MEGNVSSKRKRRCHYAQMIAALALVAAARGGLATLEAAGVVSAGSIPARIAFALCIAIGMAGARAAESAGD